MEYLKVTILFAITAITEIIGCYLPWLVFKEGKSLWLLLPGLGCLALFAYLLTLHPFAAGRTYAAYGGMYIAVALFWLWFVDGVKLSPYDWIGVIFVLIGMAIISFQPISNNQDV